LFFFLPLYICLLIFKHYLCYSQDLLKDDEIYKRLASVANGSFVRVRVVEEGYATITPAPSALARDLLLSVCKKRQTDPAACYLRAWSRALSNWVYLTDEVSSRLF
jgi:hypothetical protein